MATRLTLLCCAAASSGRSGAFPLADEPLDRRGIEQARSCPPPGGAAQVVACSPARAARDTAAAMGLAAAPDQRLADMRFGRWGGQSLAGLGVAEPEALADWLRAPERGVPGGETLDQVRARIRPWLAETAPADRTVLAITHASVIRAALAEALDLPDASVMRFDVAPLSATVLSFNGSWRLRRFGAA